MDTTVEEPSEELRTPLLQPGANGDGSEALLPHPNNDHNNGKTGDECHPNTSGDIMSHYDYESHFTLRIPTSTLNFRGSTLHIIDTDQDQIILQQTTHGNGGNEHKGKILVKRISPGTHAHRALRAGYTLFTILFLGFLFVFCVQVLLLLFIALPIDAGYTSGSQKADGVAIVSTIFSIPVMVHGMSSLMTMGSAFVVDTYNGSGLFRSTPVEILYMCVFLIVPLLTFAFSLMTGHDEAWRLTARVLAVMVCITFSVWSLAVTVKQVTLCFWLVEKHYFRDDAASSFDCVPSGGGQQEQGQDARLSGGWNRLKKIAGRALLLTQTARYSGERKQRFQFAGTDTSSSLGKEPRETKTSVYTWLTTLSFCSGIFQSLDPVKRMYSPEEIRDVLPFMTKQNFSMQKMWCSGDNHRRNVVVASGPSALTHHQVQYALVCTVTSSIVVTILVVGVFSWMGIGVLSCIIVALIAGFCCIVPVVRNGLEMQQMYQSINSEEDDERLDEGPNLYQVWETERVTEPKEWYCYARLVIEILFLFLWPFISMMTKHNYPVAMVFLFVGSFTLVWHYFDTSVVLSELGSISDVVGDEVGHQEKYRLNEVISRVNSESGRRRWFWVFVVLFVATFFASLVSNQETETVLPQERAARPPIPLVDDFYYAGVEDSLAYPTCSLSKGFQFPGDGKSDLSDYTFLSGIVYEDPTITKYMLDQWFGPDMVVDEDEFVTQFRTDSNTASSPLYFKLFSFPFNPSHAVVSIRGSETAFDWISDMQIWSAAGFAQVVKWLTPLGWVWEPLIPDLIYLVNRVESASISNVAYYKTTTKFVNEVLAGYGGKGIDNIVLTGTSLGGGVAIITAAQTDAHAVAVSGMGATLLRETFEPPIKLENLNSQTFNVIPERDLIARVGGRAPLFQNIDCTATKSDLFGCHSVWRSLCEINYKCGSNSRPVYCLCGERFGYPPPIQNGTRSFQDACKEANATWYDMFPPNQ